MSVYNILPSAIRNAPQLERSKRIAKALLFSPAKNINKIGFDVVAGCQLRCVGCPNSQIHPTVRFITEEDFVTCLGNLDTPHIRLMRLFNFGEPLLHPALPELLAKIPQQKFTVQEVELSSNAQHNDWKKLAEVFKVGVITNFFVSCDGDGTPEEYERLRPPGKWERLIEFLTRASEFKRQYAPNVKLITRTICTSEEGRKRWTKLLEPLGWETYFREWFYFPEASTDWQCQIPQQACKHIHYRNKLYVDVDGTVVPCCAHPRAFVMGNLKTQTYTQIIKGMKRKINFLNMEFNRKNMAVCGKCGIL